MVPSPGPRPVQPKLFLGIAALLLNACETARLPPHIGRVRGGAGEQQLSKDEMFAFDEALPWLSYVREHGVQQFVAMFHDNKALTSDELLWGDEIEYHLVRLDEAQKTAKVALRAEEVLEVLRQKEHQFGRRDGFGEACSWHPEYGAWMVEGTHCACLRVTLLGPFSDPSRTLP